MLRKTFFELPVPALFRQMVNQVTVFNNNQERPFEMLSTQ